MAEAKNSVKQKLAALKTKFFNIEDFIPAKKILNKKDPFVCGLSSDKQSNQ